ncbi:MAG: hypothetical protein WC180_06235 [Candidatus Paceibacterota bacterium]
MIQKAIDYLVNLGIEKNPLVTVDGKTYSLKQLSAVKEIGPDSLEFNFLDSLITYLKEDPDLTRTANRLIVEIVSPTEVGLHTQLVGQFNQRFTPVICRALLNPFPWGRFIDPEEFIIRAQSQFVETEDLAKIRQIVGNVRTEEVMSFSDDGVSQMVNAKSSITRVENVVIPPRVKLAPYRTFIEIEQPESEFVFRAKKGDGLPYFALFEADGGAWRIEAMKRIKAYLEDNLKDIKNVVVLG